MSVLHEVVGYVVESNVAPVGAIAGTPIVLLNLGGSYTWVMAFAGVVPLFGLLVLLLFWGETSVPVDAAAAERPGPDGPERTSAALVKGSLADG
jgi:hypothetical protein